MAVYILTIGIVIFLEPLTELFRLKNRRRKYICLVGIWMFLVLALRSESVGQDVPVYCKRYVEFGSIPWTEVIHNFEIRDMEIGFVIFNKILYCLCRSPRLLLVTTAALFVWILCREIDRNSADPQLSFLLYIGLGMFTRLFSGLRQQMALAVILLSFQQIRKRNMWKFLLLIFLAAAIHKSAVCVIPLYFLSHRPVNARTVGIFCIFYACCWFWGGKILLFIVTHSYSRYAKFYRGRNDGAVGALLIFSCLLVITLLYSRQSEQRSMYLYFNFVLISAAVLTFYMSIVARIFCYFDIMLLFSVPDALENVYPYDTRKAGAAIIAAVSLVYYFFIICRADVTSVIPYTFMWG